MIKLDTTRGAKLVSESLGDDQAAIARALKFEAAERLRKGGSGSGPQKGGAGQEKHLTRKEAETSAKEKGGGYKAVSYEHKDSEGYTNQSWRVETREELLTRETEEAKARLSTLKGGLGLSWEEIKAKQQRKSDSQGDLEKGGMGSGPRTGEEMGQRSDQAIKDTKLALAASKAATEATDNHEKAKDGTLQGHAAMMHSHAADAHDTACASNGKCGIAGKHTSRFHATAGSRHRDTAADLGAK